MSDAAEVTIRPATGGDRADLLRMRCALWPECPPRQLDAEIDDNAAHGQVAFLAQLPDGAIVGLAEVSIRPLVEGCDTRSPGYLEGWYVDPTWRRRGVGRRLVEAARAWARARGALEFASACELDNDLSEAAHKALGFEERMRSITFRIPLAGPDGIARATPGGSG